MLDQFIHQKVINCGVCVCLNYDSIKHFNVRLSWELNQYVYQTSQFYRVGESERRVFPWDQFAQLCLNEWATSLKHEGKHKTNSLCLIQRGQLYANQRNSALAFSSASPLCQDKLVHAGCYVVMLTYGADAPTPCHSFRELYLHLYLPHLPTEASYYIKSNKYHSFF